MPTPLKPQLIRNLGIYGVIRQAEVDDVLIPDGAVTEAINFHFDRKGASTVRLGIAGLGSSVESGVQCRGLHNHQSSTLITVFSVTGSSSIFAYSGSSWGVSVGGGQASTPIRFVDFAGRTIAVNFISASMRIWNGSANGSSYWVDSGNPINPQNMWGYTPRFGEVFKSRVYLAGDTTYPDRLFYSAVINSSGNITWSPTTDFVDINPSDGENITALKRFSLELLVFKPNYIYRFRTSAVDPDPLIKIGTRSQESISEGKRGVYFHHDSGFYRYSGGYPEEISRAISDIVDAIPYSAFANIVSWNDQDHIYWSIGDLTITDVNGSSTWKNVVVRYTESSDLWTVYSYANKITRGITFNNTSSITRVVGTDHGVIGTFNSGNTDFSEPIKFREITKWYYFEGASTRKILQQMTALCEKAQETRIFYQVDNDYTWKDLGQLRKYITTFDNLDIKLHRIRFKIAGMSRNEPAIFQGFEITQGLNEGVIIE